MGRPRALIAYLLVAAAVAATGVAVGESGNFTAVGSERVSTRQRSSGPVRSEEAAPGLARVLGQRFVGRITGTWPSRRLLARVRAGELGGVILFSDNIASVAKLRHLTAILQAAATAGDNPGFLVAIDQEGGSVKRLAAGPPWLSASQMGQRGAASAERQGRATGAYLHRLGINVELAPVLDAPSLNHWLGSRAFSSDPARVANVGVAFGQGAQHAAVAATAKHFPGLGAAAANTDTSSVTVRASASQLLSELKPFRAAARAEIRLVMVSNASYPNLDGSGRPAVVSRTIVTRLLRQRVGFRGVVISDALETPALRRYGTAAVNAMAAGVDLLLYSASEGASERAFRVAVAAARHGRLGAGQLRESYARIIALKRWLGQSSHH